MKDLDQLKRLLAEMRAGRGDHRLELLNALPDLIARLESSEMQWPQAEQEIRERGARIDELEAELRWAKSYLDFYGQQHIDGVLKKGK